MELLKWWALNAILTALLISAIISAVVGLIAMRILPHRHAGVWLLFVAVFAFSILGFVTGELLGDSREAAVGTVVPAVLTLLGGVAAYVVSEKGLESQPAIFAILICFPLALYVGSLFGIGLRAEYEDHAQDPQVLLQRDLLVENNKLALELQRLQNYVFFLSQRDGFAQEEKLDLSRFESVYEKGRSENGPIKAGDQSKVNSTTAINPGPQSK